MNFFSIFIFLVLCAYVKSEKRTKNHCDCPLRKRIVCGSNMKTYRNMCQFDCAAEELKDLIVLYEGDCDSCRCDYRFGAVCGTDNRSYPDNCILQCAARKRPALALKHFGRC